MGVQQYEDLSKDVKKLFKLDTKNTSYVIAVVDDEQFLGHVYYGQKLNDYHLDHLLRIEEGPFVPSRNNRDRGSFLDSFPMEYPAHGLGDYREDCISIRTGEGNTGLSLNYVSHKIISGKPALEGLPASFGTEQECETLEITCRDSHTGLEAVLMYTVFEDVDVITRSVKVVNASEKTLFLTRVMSACLDMDNRDFTLLTMHGSWARERQIEYRKIGYGKQSVGSCRGESSHQEHPFVALVSANAGQEQGRVYGFHFVYSGNFLAQVEKNQFDSLRVVMGIHPQDFKWELKQDETFTAPEVVMTYSDAGLGRMTRTLHDLYRKHLIRSPYKDRERPVLINNWEATYFDFDTEKLLAIAREAKKSGIEMLVMDDGWFGHRNDDNTSLGDWQVNEQKITGGLKRLVDQVNEIGLKFGIWFEPEMISEDSDLYRAHPDWAFAIPGRVPNHSRNQLVLDMTREDVREYLLERLTTIVHDAKIDYVKWDMNRSVCDVYSHVAAQNRNGELYHRYVLGVYDLLERFLAACPDLLLEGCSGGGGRYDAGMMYYSPQIWCSDNTDAINRLSIQYGSSFFYPISTVGSHVSVCPNHQTGRVTPFRTRGDVALAGSFGYEMDLNKISEEEKEMVKEQVAAMHEYYELTHEGLYYRLTGLKKQDFMAWEFVAKDQSRALLTIVKTDAEGNMLPVHTKVCGLAEDKLYRCSLDGEICSGRTWNRAGLTLHQVLGEYESIRVEFTEVK